MRNEKSVSSAETASTIGFDPKQICGFCLNPESILTVGTCCTGCYKLYQLSLRSDLNIADSNISNAQ
jgi:hypothetical protein